MPVQQGCEYWAILRIRSKWRMSEENLPASTDVESTYPAAETNGVAHAATGTGTAPASEPSPAARPKQEATEPKDSPREIVETIVFVIVLVLLLKSFVAEAFVIPTGSMAETLWGYQKEVECPQCHFKFPVNCSSEVEPPISQRETVTRCMCPNCRHVVDLPDPSKGGPPPSTGDRVLVDKSLYDLVNEPQRFDVVVFKYPKEPQKGQVAMNYIKRLVGQPGETIVIYQGDLYRTRDLKYEDSPKPIKPDAVRTTTYEDDRSAHELFQRQLDTQFAAKIDDKGFEIIRKEPAKILALRRVVNDNDFQAADLKGKPRWQAEGPWKLDDAAQPRRFEHAATSEPQTHWLTYRHLLRDSDRPQLITDFTGYNTAKVRDVSEIDRSRGLPQENWVGDLILECQVTVQKPEGKLILDLAKGVDRFQARWDLSTGVCTLLRVVDGKEQELDSRPTELKKAGSYEIRLANVDERLTVWVNGKLPFDSGVAYQPPRSRGPYQNDLQPARVGVESGAVSIEKLRLDRDTYYTICRGSNPSSSDAESGEWYYGSPSWENPDEWRPLQQLPFKTIYVQPGHYLCMGDNSPESSDGRSWGLVPRRLMLGRALFVYYPFYPFGTNRAGPIR
jgi:signal peptidase I